MHHRPVEDGQTEDHHRALGEAAREERSRGVDQPEHDEPGSHDVVDERARRHGLASSTGRS